MLKLLNSILIHLLINKKIYFPFKLKHIIFPLKKSNFTKILKF